MSAIPPDYRYWAFISYSSKDTKWGRWLHHAIETYGIPASLVGHAIPGGRPIPRRFQPLFRDRDELPASFDLSDHIEKALNQSHYLIVVCSPHAAQSRWVNKEIETFQRFGRHGSILAIIVDGEPHAGDARECFPPALLKCEPVAADARPQGDGKLNAKLKLLAGMLGVSYDTLKQRDFRRRIRRLQFVVATALITMFSFAGLAIYSNQQRVKAITARNQAEDILEYLVYDLSDKLAPIGRLDIIRDVQKQLDSYYRALGVDHGDLLTLYNQASTLIRKGDLLLQQGDSAQAMMDYRKALNVAQRLVADDPSNAHWVHQLAMCQQRIGHVLFVQRDLVAALAAYRQASAVHRRLATTYSTTVGWQQEFWSSNVNVGSLLANQGDLAGALATYLEGLAGIRRLAEADPTDASLQRDLAAGENRIGQVLSLQGDQAGALKVLRQALERLKRLVARGNPDASWLHELSSVQGRMGDALIAQNDLAAALELFLDSFEVREGLVASDPSNASWQTELSFCYGRLAVTSENMGDSNAIEWFRRFYDQLMSMKRRGIMLEVDDTYLERLRIKVQR